MQTRIGHVHIRYRVPERSASSAALLPSLERIVREHIAGFCDRALAEVFEDDPTVYVLRSVSAPVSIFAARATLESRLAAQWGHRLSGAITRAVMAAESSNLVRFDNQADFVARFLTDIVTGRAWDQWYYGAFR